MSPFTATAPGHTHGHSKKAQLSLAFSEWKENTGAAGRVGRKLSSCQSASAAIQRDHRPPAPIATTQTSFSLCNSMPLPSLGVSRGSHGSTPRRNTLPIPSPDPAALRQVIRCSPSPRQRILCAERSSSSLVTAACFAAADTAFRLCSHYESTRQRPACRAPLGNTLSVYTHWDRDEAETTVTTCSGI